VSGCIAITQNDYPRCFPTFLNLPEFQATSGKGVATDA